MTTTLISTHESNLLNMRESDANDTGVHSCDKNVFEQNNQYRITIVPRNMTRDRTSSGIAMKTLTSHNLNPSQKFGMWN